MTKTNLPKPIISLIVCTDKNGGIGLNGKMPWNNDDPIVAGDLTKFKEFTLETICICGRKTWHSIPKKYLSNRMLIVISSDIEKCENEKKEFNILENDLVVFENSLEKAILRASKIINASKNYRNEINIIGGAKIYNEAISKNIVNKFIITVLNKIFYADTFFPLKQIFDSSQYKNKSCQVVKDSHSAKVLREIWTLKK